MALPQYHFQTQDRCQLNSHCREAHRRICRHLQHGTCHHLPQDTPAGTYACMIDSRCREVHAQACAQCPNHRGRHEGGPEADL